MPFSFDTLKLDIAQGRAADDAELARVPVNDLNAWLQQWCSRRNGYMMGPAQLMEGARGLIDAGADPTWLCPLGKPQKRRGQLPIDAVGLAAQGTQPKLVRYLLERGGRPDRTDAVSAMNGACEVGQVDTAQVLHEFGAPLDRINEQGFDPLYCALLGNQCGPLAYLVRQGVPLDRTYTDADGQGCYTLLQLATQLSRVEPDTCALLLELMTDPLVPGTEVNRATLQEFLSQSLEDMKFSSDYFAREIDPVLRRLRAQFQGVALEKGVPASSGFASPRRC